MDGVKDTVYHVPVLLTEALDGLEIKPGGVYVDVTFGGGGHSRGILQRLGSEGHLYGFDRDMDAMANTVDDPRFTFVHSNYRYLSNFLHYHGEKEVDGILADLGVSSHHFDSQERGFSFRSDAPLDMRMNRAGGITAAEYIASTSAADLERILRAYSDIKRPGYVASAIIKAREERPITGTLQLVEAVEKTLNLRQLKKDLAQVFQAIRIEINGEMKALGKFLESSVKVLRPGGRLAVITYHSIEDRMVKNFMRTGNLEGIEEKDFYGNVSTPWKVITRTPITPTPREVEENPRSRSAKLRIAEKK